MFHIPSILSADELQQCHALLASASWHDGKITAGQQAAKAKNNFQLDESSTEVKALQAIILQALSKNSLFFSAALPKQIYPLLFNKYAGDANFFGDHVDNAIRTYPLNAKHTRTDLSFTLFLNQPTDYEGGDLVIQNGTTEQRIKLPAGDLILYPSYSLHRVEAVTKGERIACFSWLQSMVRSAEQRTLLFELDKATSYFRQSLNDSPECVPLTNTYHNLLRMWADV